MNYRVEKYQQEALQKATALFEALSQEEQKAFLKANADVHPLDLRKRRLHFAPLWADDAQKFEFVLLEAQDILQNEIYQPQESQHFYFFFEQYIAFLKQHRAKQKWFAPDIFAEEDWQEVVEVEQFVRLTKLKKYFEWASEDIANIRYFDEGYRASSDAELIIELEYITFTVTPESLSYHIEDAWKRSQKILAKINKAKPKPRGKYKEELLQYMLKQELDFQEVIANVENKRSLIRQDLAKVRKSFLSNQTTTNRVKMNFEIQMNTGIFGGSIDTKRYFWAMVWTIFGGIALVAFILYGMK